MPPMSDHRCKHYCLGIEALLAAVIGTMDAARRHAIVEELERHLAQRKYSEETDEVISGLLARVLRPLN